MKARFTSIFFFALSMLGFIGLDAQTPTQVIIANGGVFGSTNMVTVGAWDLNTGNYTVFDSFPGSSVQNVFIWGNDAFVCADSSLMKYDLTTYTRTAEARVYGARKTAVFLSKLVVTKGFGTYPGTSYLEVRNTSDLSLSYTLPGITDNCEGLAIVGDTAYIANPGIYTRLRGDLAVADLSTHTLMRIMDMDTMGKLVNDIFHYNGKIYTVNINRYNSPTFGWISEYDIPTATFTHYRINTSLGFAAGVDQGKIYASIGGNIGTFDLTTKTVSNFNAISGTFAGMTLDTVNHVFYGTKTDYFSYGRIYKYDLNGQVLDSATVGISPEAMAVDYNVTVGAEAPVVMDNSLKVFPQPFGDRLSIDLRHLSAAAQSMTIYDLSGRKRISQTLLGNGIVEISTATLPAGAYILKVETRKGPASIKVIKTQN
jgi:hypothetical protein